MVQLMRILSVLNIFLAIGCFIFWRQPAIISSSCMAVSIGLFLLNVRMLNRYPMEINNSISNLIFNTVAVAILLWIYILGGE
jgi:hypothetical protein